MIKTAEIVTRDGEVIPLREDAGLPEARTTRTSLILADGLSEDAWKKVGVIIETHREGVNWWIGDWWVYGENRYGERRAIVEAQEWEGPDFQTCANAATVCRAFETYRRRELLSFTHHAEVAALPAEQADQLLDWAGEPLLIGGQPRSTRELRSEVSKRRSPVGLQVSSDTCTIADLEELARRGAKFGCIYADPPWLYDNQGTRAATGNHYAGLTVDELRALPIRHLAAGDSHLHLWTTNAFLFECPKIFAAWGFEFRSSFVWAKPQFGIGNYWRNSHEILLTAIRGNAKRFNDRSLKSWMECDRGPHSSKPEQVRGMIERASPGPYLELFGRLPAERWTVFGDQIERNLFLTEDAA